MTTLALEFSSEHRSVAVVVDGEVCAEAVHQGTVQTPIFHLIREVLERAAVERRAVQRVVVGLGPGSYTGVRLALSVAQGWQLANGVSTVGVSTLENLAQRAGVGATWLAIDAQRGEFAVVEAADGRVISSPRLLATEELRRHLANGGAVAGPDVVRRLGSGLDLYPTAAIAARLAEASGHLVPAEALQPVYLREAAFVKAPPARLLPT